MAEPTVEELKAQIVELEAQVAALQSGDNLEDIGIQLALNYISWDDSIYGAYENEQRGYECTGDNETALKASFKTVQAADPLLDPR